MQKVRKDTKKKRKKKNTQHKFVTQPSIASFSRGCRTLYLWFTCAYLKPPKSEWAQVSPLTLEENYRRARVQPRQTPHPDGKRGQLIYTPDSCRASKSVRRGRIRRGKKAASDARRHVCKTTKPQARLWKTERKTRKDQIGRVWPLLSPPVDGFFPIAFLETRF